MVMGIVGLGWGYIGVIGLVGFDLWGLRLE